ncbi:TetR/AcrR family transcriptional regulator [Glaciihabitans arcticus]|uniref:TetR/AcrR family transcriptional regulator n=1 Tax=Glaciihabitans arcticus TaxID=2668039 RepID=A0A4Q9GWI5_9MICO|nr:TetR/AcrR family transcriptional regulator [Glaciihabitans arcticus]TBN57958.1 TetR/AcrR family transcriptional regulator [Glaciihabitans arcticus]
MAIDSTGESARDRTLELLWRSVLGDPTGARGPRQKVTVDQVVEAAIQLADDEGVEAISMRRVAERLGIGAMSLYTYVEGKAELLDLMIDSIVLGMPRLATTHDTLRSRLDALAREDWAHYLSHPWTVQVDTSRPPLGPGSSGRYEYQLQLVDGLGLSDLDMDSIITIVTQFTAGAARVAIDADRVRAASTQSDLEWWEANLPVLERVMGRDDYPLSERVGTAVGELFQSPGNQHHAFEFGLARLLDGIEAYVETR